VKVFLDSVGCRLNQSEIEAYARQFAAAGHSLVPTAEQADLVLVNTCAVTAAAASDSRNKIRQAARAGAGEIVVTGCWSTLYTQAALNLPSVAHVIPNADKDNLVASLLDLPGDVFDLEPLARQPVPGARLRTRAFIKVQDGCDNRCTFCITTLARGSGRSRPLAQVLADIQAALDGGCQEIVLTGVHLGSWGQDFAGTQRLHHLVETILAETDVTRLRLSSLEPWDLDAEFFRLWENPRLCRHAHLPLQSGCAATLRRMARKTTPTSFAALITSIRATVPDIAITTDIITGFPGESETEFAESLEFVRRMQFAGGHVFTYSARPGTAAARMPEQVEFSLRKKRNAQMRAVFTESAARYQGNFIGQVLPVLWESATAVGPDGWQVSGLTDNYLRVQAHAPRCVWNQITPVQLLRRDGESLHGELLGLAGD
jgi:threonylcarbamoyladenosine tRNA methylthiotransferase MtaB